MSGNYPERIPSQAHNDHRLLDVTGIGHLHRRVLCLDCKTEFDVPAPGPDRSWLDHTP